MKNFTKQITNKTLFKPTRWLLVALMLLVGTSSAWGASSFASGDVIYVDVSACSWYESDGCGPGIQLNKTGNYIKMDKFADKLYTYTFAQSVTSFNLGRVAATGTTKYNSFAGNFSNYDPSSKNVFKVNDSSSGGSWGSPSFLKVYFDNSNTNWTNIYMCYGHSTYSKMNVKVNNQACGNIYYAIITDNWTDETQIAFHNSTQAETSWGSESGSIAHRYGWLNGDVTDTYPISLDNANGKVFKPSESTTKLTTGNDGKQIDARLWVGDDAYVEETFSQSMCCAAPAAFTISIDKTAICSGGNATITIPNDHSAGSYKWCTKNGNDSETPINNKSFTVSAAGTYVVRAYNSTCMTESNPVTLTVDNTITNMFIGLVNPNGGYYDANPLPLCDDQVTLKAWATGAKTYKVYKTTDLNNPVQTGTVNGDGETNVISYTISKSNLSEGAHGYQVKFENTCGTTTTDIKTVTVPTPAVPTLPTTGQKFHRTCTDHIQYVSEVAGVNMKYMAVLYEGGNATLTQPTNGTTYETDNKIGEGYVKVLQEGNAITINKLEPTQIYKLAIYRYHTTCLEYSEPLIVTIDKNVPTLGELTIINGNEFSVPVTKISARESGVSLDIMKFQYYNEDGKKWDDFKNTAATYSLQDKEQAGGVITATITPGTLTQGQTYQVRAYVTNNSCTVNDAGFNTNDITYTVPCSTVPKPQLTKNKYSVCKSETEKVNLNTLAGTNNVNWYKEDVKVADPTQVDIKNAGTTTYVVKAVNGLCESEGVEFTLTVNPLPTITSISASNDEPVPFEDVVLTATGVTSGAEVRWYLGNDVTPVATGTTYIVTSETTGDVIVKAKAFLGDCESDFKEHKVTFDEENCQGNLSNDIIINFTHPDKDETNKNCQYWGFGKLDYKINGTSQSIDLGKETTETKTIRIENIVASKITDVKFTAHYKFNSCSCEAYTTTIELEKGYEYDVTIEEGDGSGQQSSGSAEKTLVIERSVSLSTQPPLSAPAVKTVSVYSEPGSGVVNFVGRVIKTGCAAGTKIYVGYQYKKADEEWPTDGVTAGTGEKQLIPIGNNLIDFSKNIEGLADDDYHFRAYVINGYGRSADPNDYDQGVYYGIDIPVTVSSIKYPVEDPVLQWIDEEGDPYPGGAYCPDATAYVKLTYGGSKPETVVWSNSISDSNPVLVKESLGENWYELTVEKSGDLSVSLANEKNTTGAVQADAISLTMTSRISFPTTEVIDGKTTICSNDANGTILKITNAVVDYQYALYKVTNEAAGTSTKVEGPITATDGNKDNLTFTIQGAEAAGKYFVQVEETTCDQKAVSQGYTTIEVIDAGAITLTLEPSEVTVNPWLPAVLTVSITEGYDYTIDIPAPLVYTANGNVYTIKAPEPADATHPQQNQKQYGKVTFDDEEYTVTADLKTDTSSSCITPQTSTIKLTPYVEDCVSDYENP